ncbi:MAG TPA: hypothetical protein VKT18_03510, partial [Acidimicrobiales bacterium]|nr:hypothetical protein [Acidimicrobiales bacterium]
SPNAGRSWVPLATPVVDPDAVACTVVRWCVVAGGGSGGGEVAVYVSTARVSVLTLSYVPDPVIALACATPRKCAGITPESTISFVA